LKKTRFSSKNERACCMPGPKNGERPYLAVPEPTFWGPFLGLILRISDPHFISAPTFIYLFIHQHPSIR